MSTEPVQLITGDPEILVFTRDDLSKPHADLNVDVEVRYGGSRWSATFFTITNLGTLRARYSATGECAGGTYLWAADMIVVGEISARVIRETVTDLITTEELDQAFARLDAD